MQIRFICREAGTDKTVLANMFVDTVQNEVQKTLFVSSYCSIRSEYNIPYQPVASVDETKILEQYVDAIRAISAKYKLVLILDNLQWIDNFWRIYSFKEVEKESNEA